MGTRVPGGLCETTVKWVALFPLSLTLLYDEIAKITFNNWKTSLNPEAQLSSTEARVLNVRSSHSPIYFIIIIIMILLFFVCLFVLLLIPGTHLHYFSFVVAVVKNSLEKCTLIVPYFIFFLIIIIFLYPYLPSLSSLDTQQERGRLRQALYLARGSTHDPRDGDRCVRRMRAVR